MVNNGITYLTIKMGVKKKSLPFSLAFFIGYMTSCNGVLTSHIKTCCLFSHVFPPTCSDGPHFCSFPNYYVKTRFHTHNEKRTNYKEENRTTWLACDQSILNFLTIYLSPFYLPTHVIWSWLIIFSSSISLKKLKWNFYL